MDANDTKTQIEPAAQPAMNPAPPAESAQPAPQNGGTPEDTPPTVREAIEVMDELAAGLTAAAIQEKHGWSRATYFRRLQLAHELEKSDHAALALLKHEVRYRGLQRRALKRIDELTKRIDATDDSDTRAQANLDHALAALLQFVTLCEKQILDSAVRLNALPPVRKEPKPPETYLDHVRSQMTWEQCKAAGRQSIKYYMEHHPEEFENL